MHVRDAHRQGTVVDILLWVSGLLGNHDLAVRETPALERENFGVNAQYTDITTKNWRRRGATIMIGSIK